MSNTNFANGAAIGAGLLLSHDTARFQPGSRLGGNNGSVWVYCRCDAGTAVASAGQIGVIDETFTFTLIDNTNGAASFGQPVAVAPAAVAAGAYFWAQTHGTAQIQVGASCGANTQLASTATAGQLDDSVLTPTVNIAGIVLTTARGGTDGAAPAMLTNPTVGTAN